MDILFYFISFILGYMVSAFFIANILIILIFSIPNTKRLKKINCLNDTNASLIIRSNIMSIVICIFIVLVVSALNFIFLKSSLVGYIVGICLPLLLNIKKFGNTQDNRDDYNQNYYKYFEKDYQDSLFELINNIPMNK